MNDKRIFYVDFEYSHFEKQALNFMVQGSAPELLDRYLHSFPGLKEWMNCGLPAIPDVRPDATQLARRILSKL